MDIFYGNGSILNLRSKRRKILLKPFYMTANLLRVSIAFKEIRDRF